MRWLLALLVAALSACTTYEELAVTDAARPVHDTGVSHADSGRDAAIDQMTRVDAANDADANVEQAAVDSGIEGEDDGGAVGPRIIMLPTGLAGNVAVINEADGILASLKHTVYDHQTFIDESTGTYDVDCSGFTNFVIQQAVPADYAALQKGTVPRPRAIDYVDFLKFLQTTGETGWKVVTDAKTLVPGDIISWQEPPALQSSDTGHVMIVAQAPVSGPRGLEILIIDSTAEGHGTSDPRTDNHTTGVGKGTIILTVTSDGAPTGYIWSTDPGSIAYTVAVGLAHLE